ncbi:GGDEF domain-containing protein [Rhizobium ruizarguesonis]|uniref:GGDEF domain-containing protein n=1 Tax=Rhizobium ruizarguesonis TaxID=2081791 RepID=UPI001030C0F7|nr:GGDEF domain-containing protein [Rhizobium ruizarguesonis]QIJ42201.1 GGDEF domain-containing protein [Rhizobium leguminosarum]NEH29743.1 diguanylate cyclase [Rhizobium ruizarguesonis]NEJ07222.1 diguanylate cyclase [Rhizobium ruizarguesonis]NEK10030.1 diguanylate cyclase [Rhizobium ruizarguesonis]TAT85516.1 GGDEF domain-containing protein [Rhizobium ruizarguesonis]
MLLDLRTIYFIVAVSCFVLGILQLAAYATGRFERWPLWWGLSNLLVGVGSFLVALRNLVPYSVSIDGGNIVTIAGYMLMFFAVRVFSGRALDQRTFWLAILLVSVPVVLIVSDPSAISARLLYVSVICCLCDLAVAREAISIVRRERLYSAALLVGLYTCTAAIFAVRSILAATGEIGGPDPFGSSAIHSWMAVSAVAFIMLRSMAMVLMAAERSRNQLTELAHHDPLTGALNRGGLAQHLPALASQPVSLLIIDIDHFKQLNDRHGHAAGDDMLRLFASVSRGIMRSDDLLARQGGDEFLAVLKNASREDAVAIAERIRLAFAAAVLQWPDLAVFPTLSIGVAARAESGGDFERLMQKADEALYRSKREGRNRVEVFGENQQAA